MRWLLILVLITAAAVADPASDEVAQRNNDYETGAQLIRESKYAELDKVITELRARKYASGRSRLHQFYAGLRSAGKPAQVEAWRDVNEDSVAACILALALNIPGEWLERAEKLNRQANEPYLYIWQLERSGLPKADRDAALDKLVKLDKTYLEAYQVYARPLRGQELADFADRSIGRYPKLGDGMYALVYSTFADSFGKEPFRSQESVFARERIIGGYRELLKQFDGHLHYLSLFAKAAACWDDQATAAAVGRRLNGWRDPSVWEPQQWDGFQRWLSQYQP